MDRILDRMGEDLCLRNFSPATRRNYLLYARVFSEFFGRSPEELSEPEIREFLLHQVEIKGLAYDSYRQIYAALKFLYSVTLNRPWDIARIPIPAGARVAFRLCCHPSNSPVCLRQPDGPSTGPCS